MPKNKNNLLRKITYTLQSNQTHLINTLVLVLITLAVTLLVWVSNASGRVGIEEIDYNSAEYNRLQIMMNECAGMISEAQQRQEELHERKNLLREVFTPGENL